MIPVADGFFLNECSIFLLIVYVMTITMKAWFRVLAAAFKSPAPAQAIAGVSVLILVLYTGYVIPQPYMIGALRWITYIDVRQPPSGLAGPARSNRFDISASQIWVRGADSQRVPHRERCLLSTRPSGTRL